MVLKAICRRKVPESLVRNDRITQSDGFHVILHEIDDVVVQLPHVSELGSEHVIASSQPLVVLGESRNNR